MAAHIIGSIGGTQADSVPIKRALLSVSDKTGLVELGKALAAKNVEWRQGRSQIVYYRTVG